MGYVIGIDIGGSTTKIVGIKDGQMISPMQLRATDAIASVYGAFGKFLSTNKLELKDVSKVVITGAGQYAIKEKIFLLKTCKVDEFVATALGGLFLTNLKEALVVSMGTGTAFVRTNGTDIDHIGGTGVGGGTLLGLSGNILNIRNVDNIVKVAAQGDLRNIDLQIRDITTKKLSTLTPETTASNFGKISDLATPGDIAIGIINMIFQTIGMMSVFALKNDTMKDVVLTGNLTVIPQAKEIFLDLQKLFGINFVIPTNAQYATAIGAALVDDNNLIEEIK